MFALSMLLTSIRQRFIRIFKIAALVLWVVALLGWTGSAPAEAHPGNGDEISSFQARVISNCEVEFTVRYTYQSAHGDNVRMGARIQPLLGGVDSMHFTWTIPFLRRGANQETRIRVRYEAHNPPERMNTQGVRFYMYIPATETFYTRDFAYNRAWQRCSPNPAVQDKYFIVVRLDSVTIDDDKDTGFAGPEGEIQYIAAVGTGNGNEEPKIVQTTGFPYENWYEAQDNGANAVFMAGHDKAIPIFAFPEEEMGDRLLINLSVVDDDATSDFVIIGHQVVRVIASIVSGALAGPGAGGLAMTVSGEVQDAIEEAEDVDLIGTHTHLLLRSENFGMTQENGYAESFTYRAGSMTVEYTVMKVRQEADYNNWCVRVTLDRVKIVEDADGITAGEGEIYIRTRVADGYAGSLLHETPRNFPNRGTTDVDSGDNFPLGNNRRLYESCNGLPPFLFIEVDVFEDDSSFECSGRTCDDVLGVLPLMFTNRWLREHPGTHQLHDPDDVRYTVTGNDPDS